MITYSQSGEPLPDLTHEQEDILASWMRLNPEASDEKWERQYRKIAANKYPPTSAKLPKSTDEKKLTIKASKNEASEETSETLTLLRRQEERAQKRHDEAQNIKKWAKYVAYSALVPLFMMLAANGSTPDTTGNWLPDSGKFVIISGAILVLAFIINFIGDSREP